jgi:hypothetical protein
MFKIPPHKAETSIITITVQFSMVIGKVVYGLKIFLFGCRTLVFRNYRTKSAG